MNPGAQMQEPLCLLQTPAFSQAGQVRVQPGPQDPSGHTEDKPPSMFVPTRYSRGITKGGACVDGRTHSSHSAFLMFQLDICIDLPLGRTRRRCSYSDAHSLLRTCPPDTLFTVQINVNINEKQVSRAECEKCHVPWPQFSP